MIRARYFRRRKVASCVDKRISRLVIEISLLLDNKTFSSSYLYCLTKLTIPYMYYIRGLGYFVLIICNEFIVLCCEESSAFQPFPTRKFALIYDCFRIRASLQNGLYSPTKVLLPVFLFVFTLLTVFNRYRLSLEHLILSQIFFKPLENCLLLSC